MALRVPMATAYGHSGRRDTSAGPRYRNSRHSLRLEPTNKDDPDSELRLFRPAHTFKMTAYGMTFSLGTEVLTSYLTALIIGGHKRDTTRWFLRDLAFYIVRPRAAQLIGVFWLFESWYRKGLDVLVVDGVISYLAGT
ncbi:hypothetical protein LTR56_027324 [Elasticomyces elasticus]|nr:hypothetical protein LTR56_027324 [Elasticomyces elasticus]